MSGNTVHGTAETACFKYLMKTLGGVEDSTAFLGDILPLKSGVWTFQISGGRTQNQNFQVVRASRWYANGEFAGQYKSRADALEVLDKLLTSFPAYRRDRTPGCSPNVRVFEITDYPQLRSDEVSDGEREKLVYVLTAQFRVVFTRQ